MSTEHSGDAEDLTKSKTQIKKDMLALRDLGARIVALNREQQAQIPLDSALRQAIDEAGKIKSNSAKKRHMQFIGKLMRSADTAAIQAAYDAAMAASHRGVKHHHLVEKWRDRLMSDKDDAALEEFIGRYSHVDRQALRQTIRAAQREHRANATPVSARKLFRLIRETLTPQ